MQKLVDAIQVLAADLPTARVDQLADLFSTHGISSPAQLEATVRSQVVHPQLAHRLSSFFKIWYEEFSDIPASAIVLSLRTHTQVEASYRNKPDIQLMWTGPKDKTPLRRTDQALLELIHSAQQTLHVVSFAVYEIEAIWQAIVAAANRGVTISIYLETPDSSDGKISYDTLRTLGSEVADRSSVYIWPLHKRPRNPDGKHGSLHAKIAVADDHTLYVSSANLTQYAMTLNMEMGVMITGGEHAQRTADHLVRLVEMGEFELVRAKQSSPANHICSN